MGSATVTTPTHVREYAEQHFPKFLHAPEKWEEPNMTTWETFAKERKPVPASKTD